MSRDLSIGKLLCLALLLGWSCIGCGGESKSIQQARKMLSIEQNQQAIDLLAGDKSAGASYLRAIGLFRLQLKDAGLEQAQAAVDSKPDEPLYQAYLLRMRLLLGQEEREKKAVELLKITEQHPAEAAFALFSTGAYVLKEDLTRARTAFQTATSLADQIPEFWPELLNLAMDVGDFKTAEAIVQKISKQAPNELFVQKQRVLLLAATGDSEQSVELAKKLYDEGEQSGDLALLYAQALISGTPSPELDEKLTDLVNRHPSQAGLLMLYATYLGKSGRLTVALDQLNKLIETQPSELKKSLAPVTIGLALESRDLEASRNQFARGRKYLEDPSIVTYYEARIKFLEQKFEESGRLMAKVIEAKKGDQQQNRQILGEAYKWLEQAKFEQRVQERLDRATEEIQQEAAKADKTAPAGKKGSEDSDSPPSKPAAPAEAAEDKAKPSPSSPAPKAESKP